MKIRSLTHFLPLLIKAQMPAVPPPPPKVFLDSKLRNPVIQEIVPNDQFFALCLIIPVYYNRILKCFNQLQPGARESAEFESLGFHFLFENQNEN